MIGVIKIKFESSIIHHGRIFLETCAAELNKISYIVHLDGKAYRLEVSEFFGCSQFFINF